MPIRQKRVPLAQRVKVPLADIVNTSAANFPELLRQKAGQTVLDDLVYSLAGAQGDEVHILVQGTTIVAETYEEAKKADDLPAPPATPVYTGDAVTDTAQLATGTNFPPEA